MAGIYLHIPYCKVKCHYCDFHFSTNTKGSGDMVAAICQELQLRSSEFHNIPLETIYFGGGTPSLLTKKQLNQIFQTISDHYILNEKPEITLECNPDDLDLSTLKILKEAGINRLSIGTQSFDDDVLKLMNRAHNSDEALHSIQLAKKEGFDNITIDLIYGVPDKGMDYWKQQLQRFLDLEIPHLSAYCLTIEPKTVFDKWAKTNQINLPEDEVSRAQFEYMRETLRENGYLHYEISNFSKEGFISRHNTSYWKGKPYIGVGPSAHSYNGDERRWNIANNPQYIKKIEREQKFYELEKLSQKDKLNDYILTRLRTHWGINLTEIEKLGTENDLKYFYKEVERHLNAGNLKKEDDVLTLSEQGLFIADHISADLFI